MPGHPAAITSSTSPVPLTSASDNHHPSNFNSASSRSLRPRSITDNSSTTMGRTTAKTEISLPITFTPTTHRISKAKKGKRVHACEFPGCSKVFTRAEHRRRHELNHDPEARYSCTYDGCKRAFHRQDLLSRHMERHELEMQMGNPGRWEPTMQPPVMSPPSNVAKSDSMNHDMFYATTQQQNSMCIEALITPDIQLDLADDQAISWTGLDFQQPQSSRRSSMLQGNIPESIENGLFYSYPESCASSTSDGATFSLGSHARSSISSTPPTILEQYSERVLDSDLTSSPVPMHSELQCWNTPTTNMSSSSSSSSSSHMIPFSLDADFGPRHSSMQYKYPSPSTWSLPYEENNQLQPLGTWPL